MSTALNENLGTFKAIYSYEGGNSTELSFDKDQEFLLINTDNQEWWYVKMKDSEEEGYVPATYLTSIPSQIEKVSAASNDINPAAKFVTEVTDIPTFVPEVFDALDASRQEQDEGSELSSTDDDDSESDIKERIMLESISDYIKENENELAFKMNQYFVLIDDSNKEWWFVQNVSNGEEGYVPSSYMKSTKTKDEISAPSIPVTLPNLNMAEKPPSPALIKSNSKASIQSNSKVSSTPNDTEKIFQAPPSPIPSPQHQVSQSIRKGAVGNNEYIDRTEKPPLQSYLTNSESYLDKEKDKKDLKDESSESDDDEEEEEEEQDEEEQESEKSEDESEEDTASLDEQDDDVSEDVKQVLSDLKKRKSIFRSRKAKLDIPSPKEYDNLPLGFRFSSLSKSYDYGNGKAIQFLTPELNSSGFGFKDLHQTKNNMVRKRIAKCELGFTLQEIKNVPNPAPLDIVGRMIRFAIYDKMHIVSNIHTVPAYISADNVNTWRFSSKTSFFGDSNSLSNCFIRSADSDIKLCVLFELVLIVKTPTEATGKSVPGMPVSPISPISSNAQSELRYISSGWALLPLFTVDGKDLETKGYEIQVFGGAPGEKNVELASPVPAQQSRGFFGKNTGGGPKLHVKVWKMNQTMLNDIHDLPDMFVGSTVSLALLAFYRRVLANTLIGIHKETTFGSKYEPILAIIPKLIDESDLLLQMAILWQKKLKVMSSREKKSYNTLKNHFTSILLTIWPLLYIDMPPIIPGNMENTIIRSETWQKVQRDGIVSFFSKSSLIAKQFDMSELEYDYLKTFNCISLVIK